MTYMYMFIEMLKGVRIFGYGFKNPLVFAAIPVVFVVLAYLMTTDRFGPEVKASRKKRAALFVTRFVVLVLLVSAVAQPFMVSSEPVEGQNQVKVLVDSSDSMEVMPDVVSKVTSGIENEGIPVKKVEIAGSERSRIGDDVVSNLEKGGNVLLVSDGRVTGGKSLEVASQTARSLDARIYGINFSASEVEKYVDIEGPSNAMKGAKSSFTVDLGGVNVDKSASRLRVTVDGKEVMEKNLQKAEQFTFNHTFGQTGSHRVKAILTGGDKFSSNDAYFKTVQVVDPPKILYISDGNDALGKLLNGLYSVDVKSKLPSRDQLEEYYAVVAHDMPAKSLGEGGELESYVLNGNGLVLFGGPNSFDKSDGYRSMETMLPVKIGESNQASKIAIAIDASGSTKKTMGIQQQVALDILKRIDDNNKVGAVAFRASQTLKGRAYAVAPFKNEQPPTLWTLGRNRERIKDRIERIQNFGATPIGKGLEGANDLLQGSGNIILITDGGQTKNRQRPVKIARRLGAKGVNVITVLTAKDRSSISQKNLQTAKNIANAADGQLLFMTQTDRLVAQFGGSDKSLDETSLTIMNNQHPITNGVELTADPPQSNKVSMKPGGTYLVATSDGNPAVASGFVGPGRVVTFTSFYPGGNLGKLLTQPNSLLIAKAVNWAIGNPERKAENVFIVPDTQIGKSTKVTYQGETAPNVEGLSFSKTGEGRYRATVTPTRRGFQKLDGTGVQYGVNYIDEYSGFGLASNYKQSIQLSGGKLFKPGQASKIAEAVESRTVVTEESVVNWSWLPLTAALIIYLLEVLARRIYEIYGYRLAQKTPDINVTRGD